MPTRKFSYWLADTLREERAKSDVPIELVAYVLGVNTRTIDRLEDPDYLDASGDKPYGHDIDRVVATYAYVLGVDDPRDLWQLALDRWRKEGEAPDFMDDLPGARFVRPIREEAQRLREAHAGTSEKPRAKRNH